ncbi:unnamed protein product [Symbiodinium microadriaticum]|nr:unnamed protein product [Symbiodinium microadriaticum]
MQAVAKVLHLHAPSTAGPIFDTNIPTRPQRFEGFLSVLRFSSSIRCPGVGGQAAILFDLTRVGGNFFACILPREIHLSALLEYVRPLTSCRDETLEVFVGCRSRPWPSCAVVDLRDGDTVTVLRQPAETFARRQAEALFYEGAFWDHPHNMSRLTYQESICVLFRNRRFSLPIQHRTDQNLVAYVSSCLQVDPSCTLMCSFPIKDLDVQGELSTFVVAVAEVPSPATTGIDRSHTRDLFVLIDPRPLGVKPHILLLHHPSVHLPTVIALLGLSTPAAMRVGVHGGERKGDDIHVRENATLRLFAEERPDTTTSEDTSESSSSGQAEVHFSPDVSHAHRQEHGQALDGCLEVECDLAVGYANWGEQPDPPPLSTSLLDSTLPAGHSWNTGAEDCEHPDPDAEAEPPVLEDQEMEEEGPAAAPSFLLNALVYIPDYVPEVLEVRVDLPIGIRDFVDVVQQLRFADQVTGFPDLCPVTPHLWLTDLVVVLMDCRLTQSGFFARTIPSRLNRESILVAAGFRHDDAISVHIEGRIRPLGIEERVALTHGHTIHFVPRYGDVPRCFELADMLLSPQGWDPEAPMPGVQSHLNSHFLILSDAGPFTLAITPRSFVDFKGALAEAVGVAEHRLYTKVSVPQIKDSYRFGFWASGVIVATDSLSSIPCPPAARPETRRILILDQRRILRGFAWQAVEGCFVDVQLLADAYYGLCPLSHVVTFKGAAVEYREGQRVFSIVNGQVITVEFTREQDTPSSDGDQPPNLSPPPDASDLTGDNESGTELGSSADRGSPEADRRALFPTLIEVSPQPDPGWGIFLAVPAWINRRVVVCCDLSFFDGRIIAVCISPLTDSFSLCASVGLAPRAEVDIFLPGAADPLPPGGEVFLQSRTCIAFVRSGARRHATFDLQLMLRSHLGWEHSPVFPHATLDSDGYCVASYTGQFLFRLLASSSVTDSLVTLLEESAWSADSRAFFEASTLLEGPPLCSYPSISLVPRAMMSLLWPYDWTRDVSCFLGWAAGQAPSDGVKETMAPICRAAMQALLAGRPTVKSQVKHVRSHEGTPANELADSLAKFANQSPSLSVPDHCRWAAQQVRGGALPWLWLQVEATLRPEHWPAQAPEHAEATHREDASSPEDQSGFTGRARYLREQLQAMGVHVAALQEACHLFQSEKDLDAYELTTGSLPTRTELEQSLRSTQTNRAIGLDKVPGELLHFAAGQVSVALFQLFLKVSMRAAEPIQFKGGALFAIWKGKSSATQCSAHRGILVSSTPGKSFHRVARQRAIPALQNIASEMQIGGLPHFPVTMASHFVRAFQEGCAQRKRSYGLLFLDLREAFYRVVRPLLTGTSFCDEAVAQVVRSVRLPPGIMHELHEHLHGSPLPEDAGATDWASAQDIRREARQTGHLPTVPWSAEMVCSLQEVDTGLRTKEALDATWMDDATFLVVADTAADLPGAMAITGKAVLDACVSRTPLPNLDRGKTELIAHVVGAGSRGLRKDLFSLPDASLAIPRKLWDGAHIRLVPTYQHLGGFIHHDKAILYESLILSILLHGWLAAGVPAIP